MVGSWDPECVLDLAHPLVYEGTAMDPATGSRTQEPVYMSAEQLDTDVWSEVPTGYSGSHDSFSCPGDVIAWPCQGLEVGPADE